MPFSVKQALKTSAAVWLALSCAGLLTGCASVFSSAASRMTDNLAAAILNHEDLATVEAGGPAYLLMADGMILGAPENEGLLISGADLYTAYAGVFVTDSDRAKILTDKALGYAFRALRARKKAACGLRDMDFHAFASLIEGTEDPDVPALYALGSAWAGWIQAHREDFNAVAEISRVETVMRQVIRLDETYQEGGAHLYLGVLATLLPPALGGKPDEGKRHFERAVELSDGKNLMAKVVYARQYARLVFDRELHDRLLKEVLAADPDAPGHALMNHLAQKQATELLNSADDYF